MAAYGKNQGGVASGNGNERTPKTSPTPSTGFQESPKGERPAGGPGEAIGPNGRGWK